MADFLGAGRHFIWLMGLLQPHMIVRLLLLIVICIVGRKLYPMVTVRVVGQELCPSDFLLQPG